MLSGKQRRYLRGLGHALEPVVQVGKDGVTDGVGAAAAAALLQHELVKIKLGTNTPDERHDAAKALAKLSASELVQVLGNTILLYKRHPDEPKIELPRK